MPPPGNAPPKKPMPNQAQQLPPTAPPGNAPMVQNQVNPAMPSNSGGLPQQAPPNPQLAGAAGGPPMPQQGPMPGQPMPGPEMMEEPGPEEPYGAQILRRVHDDHMNLLEDYDQLLGVLDNSNVRNFMMELLSGMDQLMSSAEQFFMEEYGHLDPIAGDMEEESLPAGPGGQPLPDGDDVVEGMQLPARKSLHGKRVKVLVCPDCENNPCVCDEVCPECMSDPCECDVVVEEEDGEISDDEVERIKEAALFLKALSDGEEVSFGEQERMKSFHFHKSLETIGQKAV